MYLNYRIRLIVEGITILLANLYLNNKSGKFSIGLIYGSKNKNFLCSLKIQEEIKCQQQEG